MANKKSKAKQNFGGTERLFVKQVVSLMLHTRIIYCHVGVGTAVHMYSVDLDIHSTFLERYMNVVIFSLKRMGLQCGVKFISHQIPSLILKYLSNIRI